MNWRQSAHVLYQTTRASFLAQEKNSSLGMLWHVLNPLLMTAVLYAVFSRLGVLRQIENYALFILVGLIHYNFFVNTTTRCAQHFLASRSLVLNTTVPLHLLVLRQSCIESATLLVELAVVIGLGLVLGVDFNGWFAAYPLALLGLLLLSIGASLFLCGLVVLLRDLNYLWTVFCRMLFFLTPVMFTTELIGEGFARVLLEINPLTSIVALARAALMAAEPLDLPQVAAVLLGPLLVLVLGLGTFRTMRHRIPDFI